MPIGRFAPARRARARTLSGTRSSVRAAIRSMWSLGEKFRVRETIARRYLWFAYPTIADQGSFLLQWLESELNFDIPQNGGHTLFAIAMALLPALFTSTALYMSVNPECVSRAEALYPNAVRVAYAAGAENVDVTNSLEWIIMNDFGPANCSNVLAIMPWGGLVTGEYGRNDRGWRLVSNAFLHFSGMHLLGNLIGLAVMLWYLEPRYGPLFIAIASLSGIFSSDFLQLATMPGGYIIAGSSVIVFALFGVFAFDNIINHCFVSAPYVNAIASIIPPIVIISEFALQDTLVARYGHLGGYLGGLGAALLIFPRFTDYRPPPVGAPEIGGAIELGIVAPDSAAPRLAEFHSPQVQQTLVSYPIARRPWAYALRYYFSRILGAGIIMSLLVIVPVVLYTSE